MKVRVLGCSGSIAKDCRTTSFLIGDSVLIDAGTGVGDLTLQEMCKIDHVFLTHSHLDHISALPLLLDATSTLRNSPVHVHALSDTIEALKRHIFNRVIWPDFSALPTPESPFLRYHPLETGEEINVNGLCVLALPVQHTVPALGFAAQGTSGWWVFSGDTGPNPAFWQRLRTLNVAMLVIETAFSDSESDLAARSLHLSPRTLAKELALIPGHDSYPIYITHTKPSEAPLIMQEIQHLLCGSPHSVHQLRDGQTFQI